MLKQISEHIYILPFNQETDRPNLGYIKGNIYSIRIDAGNSKNHNELFIKEYQSINLNKPELCVITHWHWDHTFGMHDLECPSIASIKTKERLEIVKTWEWTNEAMSNRLISGEEIEFCDTNIKKEYSDLNEIKVVLPDHTLDGTLRLDLGNCHVSLITTDSPHSKDATVVLVEEDKVLFVADADCEDFYHGAIYDKKRLKIFIDLLESLDFDIYVLGHAENETKQQALTRLYTVYNTL